MALALVLVIATLASCGGGSAGSGGAEGNPDKYEQTWPKNYADTTCSDWNDTLDDHQQWVAAADMLTGAQKTDGGSDVPGDSLIDTFRDGITTACVIPSQSLTDIGVGLYISEKARFAP